MSKTPVRQALKLLEQEGLLERGARRQLVVRGLSAEHREEILEVRAPLEEIAVRHACRAMTSEQLDVLHLLLMRRRRAAQAADDEAFITLDEEFHLAIARGGGLELVHKLLGQLGGFVRIMRLGATRTEDSCCSSWRSTSRSSKRSSGATKTQPCRRWSRISRRRGTSTAPPRGTRR